MLQMLPLDHSDYSAFTCELLDYATLWIKLGTIEALTYKLNDIKINSNLFTALSWEPLLLSLIMDCVH